MASLEFSSRSHAKNPGNQDEVIVFRAVFVINVLRSQRDADVLFIFRLTLTLRSRPRFPFRCCRFSLRQMRINERRSTCLFANLKNSSVVSANWMLVF